MQNSTYLCLVIGPEVEAGASTLLRFPDAMRQYPHLAEQALQRGLIEAAEDKDSRQRIVRIFHKDFKQLGISPKAVAPKQTQYFEAIQTNNNSASGTEWRHITLNTHISAPVSFRNQRKSRRRGSETPQKTQRSDLESRPPPTSTQCRAPASNDPGQRHFATNHQDDSPSDVSLNANNIHVVDQKRTTRESISDISRPRRRTGISTIRALLNYDNDTPDTVHKGRQTDYRCSKAPISLMPLLGNLLFNAVAASNQWKWERKVGGVATNCLNATVPEDRSQDISITLSVGYIEGLDVIENFQLVTT